MAIDRLGQEVKVGDWCAITQHNEVYVGKVIKEGTTVTIARNRIESDLIGLKQKSYYNGGPTYIYKELGDTFENFLNKRYNIDFKTFHKSVSYSWSPLSFVRDNKFIKITPTREMELAYENIK